MAPFDEALVDYRGGVRKAYLKEFAKENRRKATEAEALFWEAVKAKKVNGLKFRRQHQIDKYIVDFYCDQLKLIVELDGRSHLGPAQFKKDQIRQAALESLGFRVLRFPNSDIKRSLDAVLQILQRPVKGCQAHH